MPPLRSSAVTLRSIAYGDSDSIVTFFSRDYGKVSLMAKGARKSVKRFSGILELFSVLDLVWTQGRGKGLCILQEASVVNPFEGLRTDFSKTAYAAHWCELVYHWMQAGHPQPAVYDLLIYVLDRLSEGALSDEVLHIAFQLHFMRINGFAPTLDHCVKCGKPLDRFKGTSVAFNMKKGGVACARCHAGAPAPGGVSKGTVKQLRWVLSRPLSTLSRVRFSGQVLEEGCRVLEAFVPYHLGRETKSLKVLKHLQRGKITPLKKLNSNRGTH
ncbi:MAG: DNA repair protein RecO [Deltaproteobacteria bacterium]|nr:DNA repair protein RecO [Deltaproteobacteria bacterium]